MGGRVGGGLPHVVLSPVLAALLLFPLALVSIDLDGRGTESHTSALGLGVARAADLPWIELTPLVRSGKRVAGPDLHQGLVVYEEQVPGSGAVQVRAVDVASGDSWPLSPDGSGNQKYPRLHGSNVVWVDWRNGTPPALFKYDVHDESVAQLDAMLKTTTTAPAIHGNFVAYQGSDGRVHLRDLAGTQDTVVDLSTANRVEDAPSLADGLIAFQQTGADGVAHVRLFSFSTDGGDFNPQSVLDTASFAKSSRQTKPQVSGDGDSWTLVWLDSRKGAAGVYGYRKGVGQFAIAAGGAAKESPAIHDDLVVWTELKSGGQFDLYGYSISRGVTFPIATGPASSSDPRVFDGRVVWLESKSGAVEEIHTATIRWEAQEATS
ncbi:MAG: hypothetical protein ACM3US_00280, partial [Sphingomonadaceae bacterium]